MTKNRNSKPPAIGLFNKLFKKIEYFALSLDPNQLQTGGFLKPIRKRLLIPLAVVMVSIMIGFGIIFYDRQKEILEQASTNKLQIAADEFAEFQNRQSRVLLTIGEHILLDDELVNLLRSEDREALLAVYEDDFMLLNTQYGITHFYFHKPDRVNLLRIHNPEKFADLITRFTALEAESTGQPSAGIELGPLGTFTLRVVLPVFDGNELLGYLELGKEIEDILDIIHRQYDTEVVVTIFKDKLDRSQWEQGMSMLGRSSDWDQFSEKAIIYNTFLELPAEFSPYIIEDMHTHRILTSTVQSNDKNWKLLVSPLYDISGMEVGDIMIFYDVTKFITQSNRSILKTIGAGMVILSLELGFLYISLKRVDKEINKQQKLLARSEERLNLAMTVANDGIWDFNLITNSLHFDSRYFSMAGYEPDEFPHSQKEWQKRVHPDDIERSNDALNQLITQKIDNYDIEFQFLRKNGEYMWIRSVAGIVENDNRGFPTRIVGTHSDITRRKHAEDRLKYLAMHDDLTSLPNRKLLEDRMNQAVRHRKHTHKYLGLLFIDVDDFKLINDTFGHKQGDNALRFVAQKLKDCVRNEDTVSRIGGDEFAIILENIASAENIVPIAEKIIQKFSEPVILDGIEVTITISIGISIFPDDGDDFVSLLKSADKAMYKAKTQGKNMYT